MALTFSRKAKNRSADSPASSAAADPLSRAEALAAAGDYPSAIALLHDAAKSSEDPRYLVRLLELRHDGYFASVHPSGPTQWPPAVKDLFSGVEGIPEIPASELSLEAIQAGILCHGALIVRGLIDSEYIERLRVDVREGFDAFDAIKAGETRDDLEKWYHPFYPSDEGVRDYKVPARDFIRDGAGVLLADTPRGFHDWITCIRDTGLYDLITEYFGERPALSLSKTTLRDVAPNAGHGWHQDGAFLGKEIRSLNVWLSLSHCGVDAPSMEFVARRYDEIVPTGEGGALLDWMVGDGTVPDYQYGSPIVRPIFAPGDAMLFDQMALHTTAESKEWTKSRLAIESWFFAPSSYPEREVPFLV